MSEFGNKSQDAKKSDYIINNKMVMGDYYIRHFHLGTKTVPDVHHGELKEEIKWKKALVHTSAYNST